MNNHSLQNTEEEPIWAPIERSRTRRTHKVPFIAGHSHFTRKKQGFALRLSPQHEPHATFMQPLHCDLKPESHKRIQSRTHGQPLIAEHRGTDRDRNDPSRTRRRHEVPFIAGCSHFTRKNTRFRALAFSPNQTSCNIHAM